MVAMSDMTTEEALEAIRAMGLSQDDETILDTLRRCHNNVEEALHLLLPDSPNGVSNIDNIEGYTDVAPPFHRQRGSPEDIYDVDMKDTETHPGSGGDSDRDSTTVSYCVEDENNMRDVVEEAEEIGRQRSRRGHLEEEEEFRKVPGSDDERFEYDRQVSEEGQDNLPPPYETIIKDNQQEAPEVGSGDDTKGSSLTQQDIVNDGGNPSSIEFPLTHYYELDGRVHTNQWSIPYKRDESLAICMVATIKMIREGEHFLKDVFLVLVFCFK